MSFYQDGDIAIGTKLHLHGENLNGKVAIATELCSHRVAQRPGL